MNKGVMAALITPLTADERVDIGSLESLLEWVLEGGVSGVFAGGTVGEGPALRDSEKYVLYRETVRSVRGRVPVLANVSDAGTMRSLEQVKMAAEAGVDAVVSMARIAFQQRTPGEPRDHMRTLSIVSPVPVWFYENPYATPVTSTFESLAEIASLSNVEGIKFSSSDRAMFSRCVDELADRCAMMTGNVPDIAYAASIGATGAVSGFASMLPHLCVQAFESALAGRMEESDKTIETLKSAYAIYGEDGWPYWPAAQKHALKHWGIIATNYVTSPFRQLTVGDEAVIEAALEQLEGLIPQLA